MLYQLTRTPTRLLVLVCAAEILSMASFAAWPLFLVELQPLWQLSNFSAGWISGAYFIGYVCATPILVGLTDRVDAKYIYIFSSLVGAAGAFCFAFFAAGFWSAALSWALVGAGLAGTYMPGLQILNARLDHDARIRLLPYYTSAFGVGTGFSFLLMGWVYARTDWHIAFQLAGLCSLLPLIMVALSVRPHPPAQQQMTAKRHPLDFRPAFVNRAALGYIFSYGAHSFELFAYRGWLFAYFVFAAAYYDTGLDTTALAALVSAFAMVGMLASIAGAHLCLRVERARLISRVGLLSFATAVMFSLAGLINFYVMLCFAFAYNVTIMLDSASLTAGTVASAGEDDRGALLAVHSIIGFGGGALGAPVAGFVLDIAGGETRPAAWAAAIISMGAGSALVWLILSRSRA